MQSLADKYHDASGRPLQPLTDTSQTSRAALANWQRSTLDRAKAREERRAPAAVPPALPHADQAGAQPDNPNEIRDAINAAFALPPPRPAGDVEQPPAAGPVPTMEELRKRNARRWRHDHQTTPPPLVPATEPEQPTAPDADGADPPAEPADQNGAAKSPNQRTAAAQTPPPALGPPAPDPTAETERRMANVKAAEERTAARSAGRRAASLKSAATVRARREAREHEAELNKLMEKSLDRIGERVIREQATAAEDAAQAEADPGIPTYRSILGTARGAGPDAEAELYRLAHIARATKPADWPAALRSSLATSLMTYIGNRKTPTQKGTRK